MLPVMTMEGRVTREPELRFTPSGKAVCNFTIAANDRKKNEGTGEWEDAGDPLFVRVAVWDKYGENCAESLAQGELVIVTGRLSNRKYTANDGSERTSLEMTANDVSIPLRFRTVPNAPRRDPGELPPRAAVASDDPWASTSAAADDSAPPF